MLVVEGADGADAIELTGPSGEHRAALRTAEPFATTPLAEIAYLLDGDPASNNLAWQWVASTFSHKPYIFNRENLERFSEGVYCRGCPLRDSCPFDDSYEALSAQLFPRMEASPEPPRRRR